MKKFLNKLSASGNLKEETHLDGDEHIDTHIRKSTTLPADAKDTSEEFKMKKSFSLSKATSPRFRESNGMEIDESSKKKSSNGIKKEKDNEKLNESGGEMRKSFSLKIFKSSDQPKSPTPSIKNLFSSSYEQQKNHEMEDSEEEREEEGNAFVPRDTTSFFNNNNNNNNNKNNNKNSSDPIRVPSPSSPSSRVSPSFSSSSPSFRSSSPLKSSSSFPSSPSPVPLSPTSLSSSSAVPLSPSSPPLSLSLSSSSSTTTSSTSRLPAFTQSPPSSSSLSPSLSSSSSSPFVHVPTPHVVVATDEFDHQFENFDSNSAKNSKNSKNSSGSSLQLNVRARNDSITDDYGQSEFGRERSESNYSEDMELDDNSSIHQKKAGLFSFGQNKPRKLKA